MKEKKTCKELEAMIMQEVRKHADLNDVQDVLVEPKLERDTSNWKPVFVVNGPRNTPQKAFDIAVQLSGKFDRAS